MLIKCTYMCTKRRMSYRGFTHAQLEEHERTQPGSLSPIHWPLLGAHCLLLGVQSLCQPPGLLSVSILVVCLPGHCLSPGPMSFSRAVVCIQGCCLSPGPVSISSIYPSSFWKVRVWNLQKYCKNVILDYYLLWQSDKPPLCAEISGERLMGPLVDTQTEHNMIDQK